MGAEASGEKHMTFRNREQAGELLADKVVKLKLDHSEVLVVAIPRGGVIVARAVARRLSAPLKVLVIKKLGAPHNSELAIGATASFGKPVLDQWMIRDLKIDRDYLKQEVIKKKREAAVREKLLGASVLVGNVVGKTVVVADDGLATGQTARAAARILRQSGAKKIILAVPCSPPSTLEAVRESFDEVICLVKEEFGAVGEFYEDFSEVGEEEVREVLYEVNRWSR